MATSTRPFLTTGAALAGVAAIAMAAPAVVPGQIAGVPSPMRLSAAQYQLTALSDITVQGITTALNEGFGGLLGPTDTYYPGEFNNDVKVSGFAGAAYYVLDNALTGVDPLHLDSYFFEVGTKAGNLIQGGLGAVAYVGVGSAFGVDSAPAQLVKALVSTGGTGGVDIGTAIVSLTAGIPVVGDLTSIYFTGQKPGDTTVYGTGFAGLLAYANKALPGLANLNIKGLIAGISGVIGGLSHGHDWNGSHSHHGTDSESGDTESTETEDGTEDSTESHHHSHGAASVVTKAAAATAAGPAAAATGAKPAAAVKANRDAKPAASTEVPAAVTADPADCANTPAATTDVAPTAAAPAAPKRSGQLGQAVRAAVKAALGQNGKRTKARSGS